MSSLLLLDVYVLTLCPWNANFDGHSLFVAISVDDEVPLAVNVLCLLWVDVLLVGGTKL